MAHLFHRQLIGTGSLSLLTSFVLCNLSMKIQENGGERERSTTKMALTSLSAMVAETTTFLIDLTKTRLQLHSSTRPTNAFRVASEIVRSEQGLLGLYKGLSPAILRHLFYTPIRIVGYEHFRTLFGNDAALSAKALLGGLSGVIAQVIHFQHPSLPNFRHYYCSLSMSQKGFL